MTADEPQDAPQALCASCNRFLGTASSCPYCGAAVDQRLSLRLLRLATLPLALGGLVFLLLWARSRDIETVRVGDIDRTMNMGYVRIEGVAGDPYVKRNALGRAEYVSLPIDDGTGMARLQIHSHAASLLEKGGRIPRRGDRVTADGPVRIGPDGSVSMILQSENHLSILPQDLPRCEPHEVNRSMIGRTILVEGKVRRIFLPRPGSKAPTRVILDNGRGDASLVLWADQIKVLSERGLGEGARVAARVEVGVHRERLQLSLASPDDLQVVEKGPDEPEPKRDWISLKEARTRPEDSVVKIRGRVVSKKRFKKGWRVTVRDDTDSLPLIFFEETHKGWPGLDKLVAGATIMAKVTRAAFRDRPELVVGEPGDAEILTGPPSGGSPGEKVATGAVSGREKGERLSIQGKIVGSSSIRGGRLLVLEDGSGPVQVVLWNRIGFSLTREQLSAGRSLSVTGIAGVYKGRWQVVPREAGDVKAVE